MLAESRCCFCSANKKEKKGGKCSDATFGWALLYAAASDMMCCQFVALFAEELGRLPHPACEQEHPASLFGVWSRDTVVWGGDKKKRLDHLCAKSSSI